MLKTYTEYIEKFMPLEQKKKRPWPGEHHFVSAYLIPRLYTINKRIPDYINPDGTKNIIGDVVYYQDDEHQFGIEVKFGNINFTRNEFNDWIASKKDKKWPHIFLGIGTQGMALCPWEHFREVYINAIREKIRDWNPKRIDSVYGPTKKVNLLLPLLKPKYIFSPGNNAIKANCLEKKFIEALKQQVKF